MTDSELDRAYTALCEALAAAGEARALPLLSRIARLAILEIDDPDTIEALIGRALRPTDPVAGTDADRLRQD